MAIRTTESTCMLCLSRKATKTGSHFVPAGILKHTIGPRDYEEAHTIDPVGLTTDVQYGRSNLKNTDPIPKRIEHIADYIFCNECETQLGKLESEVIRLLEKSVPRTNSVNVVDEKITDDILLRTCPKLPPTITNLFFYSLVWRVSIQQRLSHGLISVSVPFDEELRNAITNNISNDFLFTKEIKINFPHYYTIIACDEIEETSATFVMPEAELTNPQIFYIGIYIILIDHDEEIKAPNIRKELLNKRFRNGMKDESIKVVKVSRTIWDELQSSTVKYGYETYSKNMILNVSKKRKITVEAAAQILQSKVEELRDGGDATFFFNELNAYYRQLME